MTTQTKFTPGPLHITPNGYIVDRYGNGVALMCALAKEGDPVLFAAAPDLYAALEALFKESERFAIAIPSYSASQPLAAARSAARSALRKARGEE